MFRNIQFVKIKIIIWQRPDKEPAMVQQALENVINPFDENPRRREE
jgi:hypothetical protein